MTGTTISHYKILEKLGSGGMGVVYKAEDNKLKRMVALKFLPPQALAGEDEKNRFNREAQAAAALNHPHIATIHEIDEVDGQSFIAMEYVDGLSLEKEIAHGPLKLDKAIGIAIQIADGLQAAHEKGVIHRDVKTANIMFTKKGEAKIMDFGLAKLTGRTKLTKTEMTMGTTAYMSPEQGQGSEVDHRSDIFSLGVVIYEMLTRQRPFKGDYDQAVVYSIVNEEQAPITGLRSGVPLELERIVNKAMAKRPDERYQRADEMLVDLRTLKKDLPGLLKKTASAGAALSGHRGPRWQRVIPWSITTVAVLASIALWRPWRTPSPLESPSMRFIHNLPPGQTMEGEGFFGSSAALSPDGSQLVYAATNSGGATALYRRPLDQFEATHIPGTEGASNPFFSPDGQWVGFFAAGKLKKVSLAGGAPLPLCEAESGYGASWGPDETIIFCPTFTSGLLRVSAAGGAPQAVTKIRPEQGELSHRWPYILPGGKSVLFTVVTGMDAETKRIAVLSLQTGERRILLEEGTDARYASAGYLTYMRGGSLIAVPFDIHRLEMTGPAVTVLEDVNFSGEGGGYYSFSRNGSIVWVPGPGLISGLSIPPSSLFWVDRRGNAEPIQAPTRGYWAPSLSPEGQRLALTMDGLEVWVLELTRGTLTRFTFEGQNHLPVWTPDGKRLTFSSSRNGDVNLFWKRADGSGAAEQLVSSKQHQDAGSWSPDGKVLAYAQLHPETNWDIWLLLLERERRAQPFLLTPFSEYHPMISPDGRWLAYSSNESGRTEVYVQPFPDGGRKWPISTNGGREPLWARDGQELYYRNGEKVMAVAVKKGARFVAGRPRLLFEGPYLDPSNRFQLTPFGSPNYDIGVDRRFLLIRPEPRPPSTQINFALNWLE